MITWFTVGSESFNVNMIVRIHDPNNPDNSGVTVTLVGGNAPIAVPPDVVQDFRNRLGYSESLILRPPITVPLAPPIIPPSM